MTVPTTRKSRQQQRDESRERILAAAGDTFALKGYDGCSFADIAAAAGVKKALVQYHFGHKQALWEAAVTYLWQSRDANLSRYQPGGSRSTQSALAQQIYSQIIEATRQHPQWLQILFAEAATPGPRLQWLVEHHLKQDYEQGLAFIRHAQQDGLMPEAEPLDLLLLLSGALTYVLMVTPATQLVTGKDYTQQTILDRYLATIHRLLLKP